MPRKPVPKTEGYTLRMKASEKLLFQQAAQAAGLGTAEYFSSVLQAVSYAVLSYESGVPFSQVEFEKMLGAHVAQVIWPGLALEPEQEKPDSQSTAEGTQKELEALDKLEKLSRWAARKPEEPEPDKST